jgi:hypothetical protein
VTIYTKNEREIPTKNKDKKTRRVRKEGKSGTVKERNERRTENKKDNRLKVA